MFIINSIYCPRSRALGVHSEPLSIGTQAKDDDIRLGNNMEEGPCLFDIGSADGTLHLDVRCLILVQKSGQGHAGRISSSKWAT